MATKLYKRLTENTCERDKRKAPTAVGALFSDIAVNPAGIASIDDSDHGSHQEFATPVENEL